VVELELPTSYSRPVIFFGALPFVKCRPSQPYYIYTDGAFFIHYWEYNQDCSHSRKDIERICAAEAEFMRRAAGVWCSSQWIADRIAKEYHIPTERVRLVGTGPGDVPPPIEPIRYENFLVTVAADFERKGGRFAAEVVGALRGAGLDWRIKFIGAKPPVDILGRDYVDWCGWLDLKNKDDRNRFASIMSACAAQILPSRRDLTPLAIPEASLYRKATFAASVGGIPEMIEDGRTGFLFSTDETVTHIVGRLVPILRKQAELKSMGQAAFQWQQTEWNWTEVAKRIAFEFLTKNEINQPMM
jgi:glycosyltransferase involved in cell wall biosynthesis